MYEVWEMSNGLHEMVYENKTEKKNEDTNCLFVVRLSFTRCAEIQRGKSGQRNQIGHLGRFCCTNFHFLHCFEIFKVKMSGD